MTEKRTSRRAGIDILLNKYVGAEPHLCRAVNLSRGGLLVHKVFEPDLPLGEVDLEFQLPGSTRVIQARGVVLAEHEQSRAQGIRFTELDPDDVALIECYLAGGAVGVAVLGRDAR